MKTRDRDQFVSYLQACTDSQVRGVYEKEKAAGRRGYMDLAKDEAMRRKIDLGPALALWGMTATDYIKEARKDG